ncbi:Crp/Fnr family transcriptional regulator [Flammeovirga kamogawensis]|uniref:Crp/Fnr family transcriptional regulator n=1 Tax=Flammeovirga kamogawensis TaxID=373891 RepID=A0ABX8H5F3_9BACT|nr:Crp/Fnr family transcriptional regulator [Flammeovirga kamogawensis]MBB6461965.1 CRP-like cAMP-binding protein [Flammeovirga kamogawensis]QWG10430.1 Crp/Fnr family transcriptional regulator [Flammeovirga kamogawensis]TRX63940.1 Crp/Fnr family transcriptional regulator [Flammeovirga kamogawensis]
MKNKLEKILKSFNMLSDDEIAHSLTYFEIKSIKKNDILIEAGKVCDWIAFVNSGILRNYYTSSKEDEVTYCITFPNTFISAYSSFITTKKTFENIHAIVDSELLVIKKSDYQNLLNSSENWLKFSKYFSEQSYVLMENRLISLQMETAEKRYLDLMNNYPEYIQNIPLKYISSYLGITQRHLSRLRKKISF